MNFGFNEEQKSLGETVAQQLADFPALTAPDPADARDPAVWTALAELGLFSLIVPEGNGGVGLPMVDVALAIEALGAGLAPQIAASTLIATDLIAAFGTEAQKDDLLPKIAEGSLRIAIGMLEDDVGYDPGDVRTSADAGRLNGRKVLVADGRDADLFIISVQVDGRAQLVLVPSDAAGVSIRSHEDLDPSSGLCAVTFEDVAIGDSSYVKGPNADAALRRIYDVAATVYAGLEMGIAARMLDTAVEYAKTRVQFGKPIGAFQSIKHRCADMAVSVEAGRSAAYYAFWAVTESAPDVSRVSSMAKAYCGEVSRDVCNHTIQIHGGMGFTWELALHRFLRRAKVLEHGFGNHVWHYERVMAETMAMAEVDEEFEHDAA